MKPKALIITGYGINCEEETKMVFDKTGSEGQIVHINEIISNNINIEDFQIMAIPGGFSYGDDTGSGNALGNKLRNNLEEKILDFAQKDKLIIGICNGFQILTNIGLIPATNKQYGKREVALMHNSNTRYECRWVNIKTASNKCVWTRDIDTLHLPIAHGEGNFYAPEEIIASIEKNDQIVFKYIKPKGTPAMQEFPYNPNGSMKDIAAICDESGRILGMMPHPERFNSFVNEDGWELKKEKLIRENKPLPTEGDGLKLFKNASQYFK